MFDATDDARSMNGFELCGNGSTSAQYLYEHYWLQTQARRIDGTWLDGFYWSVAAGNFPIME